MNFRILIFIGSALMSVNAFAVRSGLDLSVNGKNYALGSECIAKVEYDKTHLSFNFTDECAKRLRAITRENMGDMMTVSYSGNQLFIGPIVSQLSYGFRFSTEHTSNVVLGRILNDYGVKNE